MFLGVGFLEFTLRPGVLTKYFLYFFALLLMLHKMAISNFRSGEIYIFLREVFLIKIYDPGG
jgi:hypothetical protein